MTERPSQSGLRRSLAATADDFRGFHQAHVEQETEHVQLMAAGELREVDQMLGDKAGSLRRPAIPAGFDGWLALVFSARRCGHPRSFVVKKSRGSTRIIVIRADVKSSTLSVGR